MDSSDQSLLERIHNLSGVEASVWENFETSLGEAINTDLGVLVEQVDDSAYSLDDWIRALVFFFDWMKGNHFENADFSQMLGYVQCCQSMTAESLSKPDLQLVVKQCLTDFGFENATGSQN